MQSSQSQLVSPGARYFLAQSQLTIQIGMSDPIEVDAVGSEARRDELVLFFLVEHQGHEPLNLACRDVVSVVPLNQTLALCMCCVISRCLLNLRASSASSLRSRTAYARATVSSRTRTGKVNARPLKNGRVTEAFDL